MSIFAPIKTAPADPILGLTAAFLADPNPDKINLGVGVYKDEEGATPVLDSVKRAETRIARNERSKSYLAIEGSDDYLRVVWEFIFGAESPLIEGGRLATVHAPGGTGALRVAAEFIHRELPGSTMWVSSPTWPNHGQVFGSVGLEVKTYPYFNPETNCLDAAAMFSAIREMPEGDVLVVHGCCHNPSGVDLGIEEWRKLAHVSGERNLLTLVDFAYQGFGDGLEEDATGVRILAESGLPFLVANSFSKNFGLYNERVGALTVVTGDADERDRVLSQLRICCRSNYSTPPAHGAAIVTTILSDENLKAQWQEELKSMRDRINGMRALFVGKLKEHGVRQDFSFIERQRGMFSFSGLNPQQVKTLREQFGIYIVGSGRINIAGMTPANMNPLCEAIAAVE